MFFVLVYLTKEVSIKRDKVRGYYLSKAIIKIYKVIDNGKNFVKQLMIKKRYREVKNLTIGLDEDCSTGCLLYYEYAKNHYKLIAVNLSRQKELEADPKVILANIICWAILKMLVV